MLASRRIKARSPASRSWRRRPVSRSWQRMPESRSWRQRPASVPVEDAEAGVRESCVREI
jgi:hypothetical protein